MKKVIIPCVDNVHYDLPLVQKALCIFAVYKAHRGEELLHLLGKNNIRVGNAPAACSEQLQTLDVLLNTVYKVQKYKVHRCKR